MGLMTLCLVVYSKYYILHAGYFCCMGDFLWPGISERLFIWLFCLFVSKALESEISLWA